MSYEDYLLNTAIEITFLQVFTANASASEKCIKHPEDLKKFELRRDMFDRARAKMMKDLDITRLLYKMQKFTIMKQVILKSNQARLIKLFRENTLNYNVDKK